ncbi:MAG: ABC transporter ATP-binding protein [Myxococcota bacterium]|jgi:ABC-2 type transport system ATP-binding protein|nr:ABC transporter ATP-binding protein [Myxococcota bacterium]
MIRFEKVSKRYGDFTAVKELDFEIADGEVFGFLGPNGAGKTTTLRMVTGLLQPSAGRVFIGPHDMAREPIEAKSLIGFIPDRPYLYEKLSGWELLRFVAGLYRMTRKEAALRIGELLEQFDLVQWSSTLVENYSHGMKQRLVFAAALLPRPKVLVVDEPMVGLDPRGMRLVKGIFRDLCRQEGLTVFLSTHTLDVAEEVCHRIAIVHHGEVVGMGDLESLRAKAGSESGRLEEVFFELTEKSEVQAALSEELAGGVP